MNDEAEVEETELFVAPNKERTHQITIYSNSVYTTSENNMMILPVPNPDSVKFIDLSNYKDIFKDLEKSFTIPTFGRGFFSGGKNLQVVSVGSYNATLVPDYFQIDKIDRKIFGTISPNIKNLLSKYYSPSIEQNNYSMMGFIVCKLKPSSTKYHPFAYSHKIQNSGKLFVPTRHQHHGTQEELMSDWDHNIYSFNTDKMSGNKLLEDKRVHIDTRKIPFDFGQITMFNKYNIKGLHKNFDVEFGIQS